MGDLEWVLQVLAISALVIVWTGLPLLAARDMDRRGLDGRLYGIAVLLTLPFGVVAWLWDRSTETQGAVYVVVAGLAIATFPLSVIAWLLIVQPWHSRHTKT